MIAVKCKKFNNYTQKDYDGDVSKINANTIKCPCCQHVGLHRHHQYKRTVISSNGKYQLNILRLICPNCNKTHALLPICLIPYRLYLLSDVISFIKCFISKTKYSDLDDYIPDVEPSYIRKIYLVFLHSRFYKINLNSLLSELVSSCINQFHQNFMQFRRFYDYPT